MALEEFVDLRRDLLVAVARQVREQMVFDLEGQIAGHEVQQPVPADVGRPEHLP
jgi:hypothetical protein